MQIDSFMELPKEKRPPREIWSNPEKLDKWFDEVFSRKDKQDDLSFSLDEVE